MKLRSNALTLPIRSATTLKGILKTRGMKFIKLSKKPSCTTLSPLSSTNSEKIGCMMNQAITKVVEANISA